MPRLADLYPSKWLTAADLPEEGLILTIRIIDIEKMRDGTEKPIVYFKEESKGLVLNKTNAKSIEKMYGDDTDDWVGQRISLFSTFTDFGGDQVECIRVKPKKPKDAKPAPQPAAKAVKPPAREPGEDDGVEDDDPPY